MLLNEIPEEILDAILSFCEIKVLFQTSRTCRFWKENVVPTILIKTKTSSQLSTLALVYPAIINTIINTPMLYQKLEIGDGFTLAHRYSEFAKRIFQDEKAINALNHYQLRHLCGKYPEFLERVENDRKLFNKLDEEDLREIEEYSDDLRRQKLGITK